MVVELEAIGLFVASTTTCLLDRPRPVKMLGIIDQGDSMNCASTWFQSSRPGKAALTRIWLAYDGRVYGDRSRRISPTFPPSWPPRAFPSIRAAWAFWPATILNLRATSAAIGRSRSDVSTGYFRQYLNADGWQQERHPEAISTRWRAT